MPGIQPCARSLSITGLLAALSLVFSHSTDLDARKRDAAPPAVSITSPSAGATVTGTVTVEATATDNVAVASVQFKVDGANIGSKDISYPYAVAWNTAMVPAGTHTLTAVAVDTVGNTRTSAGVTVTVPAAGDSTPPTVSITAPAAGTTVSGTVTVAVNATDDVSVAGVQLRLDGVNLGSEMTTGPYTGGWNTTTATEGSHTLTAVARDAAGNTTTSAGVTVSVSNLAPPPPSAGIASQYPGDVGIENHRDVVFVERFDESSKTALFNRWTSVGNGDAMLFTTDVPAGSPVGSHALDIPWVGGGVNDGGALYKLLSPGIDDTLYVRFYIKYPTAGRYSHNGVWMGGTNPPLAWPDPHAGEKPTGSDRFIAAAEQNPTMGLFDHYDYWMNMRSDGNGDYWGNMLLNDRSVQAPTGQWTCIEHMVKLNNPTLSSNGEHAIWLDGVKVSHLGQGFPNGTWSGGIFTQSSTGTPFEGFRWRSDINLNLNWIWLQNYSPYDPAGFTGHMKFAHVVVAKSYIGCLATP